MSGAVDEAVGALNQAIANMPEGSPPKSPRVAALWPTTGRAVLGRWVDDLERLLTRSATNLELARGQGPTADGGDALEFALWSMDAARERLVVVASFALGVQLLEVNSDRRSVGFRADPKRLEKRLLDMALEYPVAGRVNDLGKAAAEHTATDLRNELSHSLSQVAGVKELIWIDLVQVKGGRELSSESKSLHRTDHFLSSGDISLESVWEIALGFTGEGLALLTDEVAALAELVQVAGRLEPPVAVYWDQDVEHVSLEPPTSGGSVH